jgi:IS30 family transposase
MRSIAGRLGRHPSTISRELLRNADRAGCYRATTAHAQAYERASRPKPSKLATNLELRTKVEEDLGRRYSPEQIVGRLRRQFPDDPEMRVSPETIYQSLYVQSRGALRRDLTRCLQTGRALRRPRRQPHLRRNRIPDMINISDRPAEAEDRAVPGHWEGDLILGKNNLSAIGTLVERTTGYTMLVHLPDGYKAEQVRDALTEKIQTIPDILRASLTWDQGPEMRDWQQVSVASDIDIYFCDPHSPWQRATNENTNGLLRQYFPKGTDLSLHSAIDLDRVATELNDRPRKRLGFAKPIEEIGPLLLRSPPESANPDRTQDGRGRTVQNKADVVAGRPSCWLGAARLQSWRDAGHDGGVDELDRRRRLEDCLRSMSRRCARTRCDGSTPRRPRTR